jgi:HEAT repeat protein
MRVGSAARLFATEAVWKSTGSKAAGRSLVRALGSNDENLRTMAGMFLVRGGRRAEPLLLEALARGEDQVMVVSVLGDIDDPALEPVLTDLQDHPDPKVAQAARDGLRTLHFRRGSQGPGDPSPPGSDDDPSTNL